MEKRGKFGVITNGEPKKVLGDTPEMVEEKRKMDQKRIDFVQLMRRKQLEYLAATDKTFKDRFKMEVSPNGNLIGINGREWPNSPSSLIRDPEAFKQIEEQARKELNFPLQDE